MCSSLIVCSLFFASLAGTFLHDINNDIMYAIVIICSHLPRVGVDKSCSEDSSTRCIS